MFLTLLISIFIIVCIHQLVTMQKYNMNGFVIYTQDKQEISTNISLLNPILYHHTENFICDKQHLLQSLHINDYQNDTNIRMCDIKNHFDKNNFTDIVNILQDIIKNSLYYPQYSVNILQGDNILPSQKNIYNLQTISIIDGEAVLYLINPKHSKDIEGKQSQEIKKWAHKIPVFENNIIIIPTNWHYFMETKQKEKTIYLENKFSTYFTLPPLRIKEYYYTHKSI